MLPTLRRRCSPSMTRRRAVDVVGMGMVVGMVVETGVGTGVGTVVVVVVTGPVVAVRAVGDVVSVVGASKKASSSSSEVSTEDGGLRVSCFLTIGVGVVDVLSVLLVVSFPELFFGDVFLFFFCLDTVVHPSSSAICGTGCDFRLVRVGSVWLWWMGCCREREYQEAAVDFSISNLALYFSQQRHKPPFMPF